jgi:hypothetical protein
VAVSIDSVPGPRHNRQCPYLAFQFQGAGDGFPLDDVIVHAISIAGDAVVLEIQAKHKITFSPGDTVFQTEAKLRPKRCALSWQPFTALSLPGCGVTALH